MDPSAVAAQRGNVAGLGRGGGALGVGMYGRSACLFSGVLAGGDAAGGDERDGGMIDVFRRNRLLRCMPSPRLPSTDFLKLKTLPQMRGEIR